MQREISKIVWLLLLPVICAVLLLPRQAYADQAVSATIPVKVEKTSGAPNGTQYPIVLEAVTVGAPMPTETTITVKDGEKGEFGPITYTLPGDYEYRIREVYENNGEQKDFTYDTTVYEVTVRIVNDGKGGLASEIGVKKQGATNKAAEITFNNKYSAPKPSTTATTASTTRTTIITKYQTVPSTIVKNNNSATNNNNPATKSNTVSSLKGPKTGDDSNPMFWFSILILSWFGIMGVITIRNRRKHSEV